MKNNRIMKSGVGLLCVLAAVGCGVSSKGNIGNMPLYRQMPLEPEWIRNGEPLIFEKELWYPQDSFDLLLDSEVYLVGEYNDVQVFIQKIDVRPFSRLYTKFEKNKYRVYEKKPTNDKNKENF